MRESCLDCVRKHIAQALILLTESKLGHPEHKWLAVGHLAEAEAESVADYEVLAKSIRNERLKIIDDKKFNLLILIEQATILSKEKK
ncbi:unnamed protein product [marine sediment metagenome]|uniref:Uncharacterized protein n=1 Tax=marine sediment metagenome TaxID=412755 RepID=X0S9L8_9ZZZZ